MQPVKKYFTEGLIQVAILLSLVGIRVDVNPYLPPLHEIIQGQSSALTQAQFHNLHNSLEGHGLHPKSVDLDEFFPTHRLLRWVRSLDNLQVPTAQLEAWLVHREPENSATMMPIQAGALDGIDVLMDLEDSEGLTMRMGGGETADLGYGPFANESLESAASLTRTDNEDIKEEDEFSLWQEPNHNVHQEQQSQGHQHLSLLNQDDEDELMLDRWRDTYPFDDQLGSIFREDVQFAGLEEDTSFSIEECLHLLEANLPLENQQHVADADVEDPPQHHGSLLSPLMSEHEPFLDLEQQWQDVKAIMEAEDMDVGDPLGNSYDNVDVGIRSSEIGSMENSAHQNINLHQSTLSVSRQICFGSSHEDSCLSNQNQMQHLSNSSSNRALNLNETDSEITDFLLSPPLDSSVYNNNLPNSSMEEQGLLSLFDPLLDEDMFNQISLFNLGQEEGFGQLQGSQLEEQEETDSDSGLSLHFSQSPASPSGSESSCSSSSSSSWSLSSTESASEEGAVGFAPLKEELTDEEEEGAVGGYIQEQNKMYSTNFLQAGHFHVGHDHTYNQPHYISQRQATKQCTYNSLEHDIQDKVSTRDEKRARAMKIPFSNDRIINLPVEEFNQLLAKHRLNEAQLILIRDIRRRGKNKMAAQNCRRRKLDTIVGLEHSVDGLRHHRARLLKEKSEILRSVKEMKLRLNDLYQELYSRLREEQGILCSTSDWTPQQDDHSHTSLSARHGSESRRKPGTKRKDEE